MDNMISFTDILKNAKYVQYCDGELRLIRDSETIVAEFAGNRLVLTVKGNDGSELRELDCPDFGRRALRLLSYEEEDAIRLADLRLRAVIDFIRDHVPFETISRMGLYENGFWRIHDLAARCGERALLLIDDNAALGYIVALNDKFIEPGQYEKHEWLMRCEELLAVKRRRICGAAGFPETESSVKILSKTRLETVNVENLNTLRGLMNLGDAYVMKTLRHLSFIDKYVIDSLADERTRSVITPSFFEFISEMSEEAPDFCAELTAMVWDIFKMCDLLGREVNFKITTLEKVFAVYGKLSLELRKPGMEFALSPLVSEFPESPLPDFISDYFSVEFLPDFKSLVKWGRRQNNCVPTYYDKIRKNRFFLYKITAPEEATVSVCKVSSRDYEIQEIAGRNNLPVFSETRRRAEEWIRGEIQSKIQDVLSFPLPADKIGELEIKPLTSLWRLENLDYERYHSFSREDVLENRSVFVYEILSPRRGLVALKRVDGNWDAVLRESCGGGEFDERVYDLIDEWVWRHLPAGSVRQQRFPLGSCCLG